MSDKKTGITVTVIADTDNFKKELSSMSTMFKKITAAIDEYTNASDTAIIFNSRPVSAEEAVNNIDKAIRKCINKI